MRIESLFDEDPAERARALEAVRAAPEHLRSAWAAQLGPIARREAENVAAEEEGAISARSPASRQPELERILHVLGVLQVPAAKALLLRTADEGSPTVKRTLARALRGVATTSARATLHYLLSDEVTRAEAMHAIAGAPWPAILPDLIEIAESDDDGLRLAIPAIAMCGASFGVDERNAAADFLLEQLDDERVQPLVIDALLRHGATFPGLENHARRLAAGGGKQRVFGLCLLARVGIAAEHLHDLARLAPRVEDGVVQPALAAWAHDRDPSIRAAAEAVVGAFASA